MWFKSRFEKEFGFKSNPALKRQEQAQVDSHLRTLASALHAACRREEALQKDRIPAVFGKEHGKRVGALEEASFYVKYWKKLFWKAHGLAERAGYEVYNKYTDYLPLSRYA